MMMAIGKKGKIMNLKLALRALFKSPFVTVVAIVSIALGIGANTAIFSIFDQVLLRALPVQEPDKLVNLSSPQRQGSGSVTCGMAGGIGEVFSYLMFRDLERVQNVFTGIAAHSEFQANLAARSITINGNGLFVSGSYFPVLGVRAVLGRLLGPEDDRAPGESLHARGPHEKIAQEIIGRSHHHPFEISADFRPGNTPVEVRFIDLDRVVAPDKLCVVMGEKEHGV